MKCPRCKKTDIYVVHHYIGSEGFRVREYDKETQTIVVNGDAKWDEVIGVKREYLSCSGCGHDWPLRKREVQYE